MPLLITVLPENLPGESADKILKAFHSAIEVAGFCSDSILVDTAEWKRPVNELLSDARIIHHPYRTLNF
jgi:hypothetical protein